MAGLFLRPQREFMRVTGNIYELILRMGGQGFRRRIGIRYLRNITEHKKLNKVRFREQGLGFMKFVVNLKRSAGRFGSAKVRWAKGRPSASFYRWRIQGKQLVQP